MYCIYRVLFMSDSLSSVWGHSVHFICFQMLRFKRLPLPQFSSSFNQFYAKYGNHVGIQVITFLMICQIYDRSSQLHCHYHKTSSGKGQAQRHSPWVACLSRSFLPFLPVLLPVNLSLLLSLSLRSVSFSFFLSFLHAFILLLPCPSSL